MNPVLKTNQIDFQPMASDSLDFQPIDFQADQTQPNQIQEQPQPGLAKRIFGGIGNFLTGSEQGVARAATSAFGAQEVSPKIAAQNANTVQTYLNQAKKLQSTNPTRAAFYKHLASELSSGMSGQAEQQLANIPSNFQAGLDVAGTVADILSAGTYKGILKGGTESFKLATKGVPSAITGAEKLGQKVTTSFEKRAAAKTADKITEMVSPKLTAKETAQAVAERGTTKSGIFGKIKAVADPYVKKVSETVQKFVPEFNPFKTISENLNATKKAVYAMGSDLKQKVIDSGKDIIYSFKELSSKLNKIEEPISLKGTPFEKQIGPLKNAAIAIAKKAGGTVSSLYNTMKEFDVLVNKTYPNLYDKEYSAIRTVVKGVRDTMADFAAEKIPDVAFKETRTAMSHLLSAVDNMSEKVASGLEKEVGTTAPQRFFGRHPVAKKVIQGAVGGGLTVEGARRIFTGSF